MSFVMSSYITEVLAVKFSIKWFSSEIVLLYYVLCTVIFQRCSLYSSHIQWSPAHPLSILAPNRCIFPRRPCISAPVCEASNLNTIICTGHLHLSKARCTCIGSLLPTRVRCIPVSGNCIPPRDDVYLYRVIASTQTRCKPVSGDCIHPDTMYTCIG